MTDPRSPPEPGQPSEAAVSGSATIAQRGSETRAYDFRRPSLVSKERLRSLESMTGTLCKSLEGWLSARVRGAVDLRLVSIEQQSFREFTDSLPNPTAAFVFDASAGAAHHVVMDFGRELAVWIVERLLGWSGQPLTLERPLTAFERMIVRIVAEQASIQLRDVWKEHLPLELTLSRFESEPELLRTAERGDPMVVVNIEARAAHLEGRLLLCFPFPMLEKYFTAVGAPRPPTGRSKERAADRLAAEKSLRLVTLDVAVRTPAFAISFGDIPALAPGRTLWTPLPPDMVLSVQVEGHQQFSAVPGREGNRLAVRILGRTGGHGQPATETQPRSKLMAKLMQSGSGEEGTPIDLAELQAQAGAGAGAGNPLTSLYHVTLPVVIELGRARLSVQEVLELGQGSVVPLDRLVGEPVDVIIGERHFAEGEVVVVGEQFGVRITRMTATGNGAPAAR